MPEIYEGVTPGLLYQPLSHQERAAEHILDNDSAGLFIDMGLGKTVTTLTALSRLIHDRFEVNKVLIIGPKFVCSDTWPKEIVKWEHTRCLSFVNLAGKTERQRRQLLERDADIYIINKELVDWIVALYGASWPFDTVVIDELSTFKNHRSVRFKALRLALPYTRRVIGLTGTPVPKNILDLWAQLYLLDRGERLGKKFTEYREAYFKPNQRKGHIVYNYKLTNDSSADLIYEKINDICISMRAADYLQLPERIDRYIKIELGAMDAKNYKTFERDQILQLQGEEITALSAGVLTNKLVQFCNGAVYTTKPQYIEVNKIKLEALQDIVEAADGHPVLVFYSFLSDKVRIAEALKKYNVVDLKEKGAIDRWNRKEIAVGLAHPASMGHGVNLQAGGNIIVWFGVPWSLELYQQANARLHRMGQTQAVIIHHLTIANSVEDDILAALAEKEDGQERLLNALKVRVRTVLKERR